MIFAIQYSQLSLQVTVSAFNHIHTCGWYTRMSPFSNPIVSDLEGYILKGYQLYSEACSILDKQYMVVSLVSLY